MHRYTYTVRAHTSASPEQVWELLIDAPGWPSWCRIQRGTYEREGDPAPHGIGAIRNFGTGPVTSREEVVAFEAPRHFAYVLLSGLPIRGYRADVRLIPDGRGTEIEWSGGFDATSRILGNFWITVLREAIIKDIARSLAKAADRL